MYPFYFYVTCLQYKHIPYKHLRYNTSRDNNDRSWYQNLSR